MKLLAQCKFWCLVCALAFAAMPTLADNTHYCPFFLGAPGGQVPQQRGEITFSPYTHHWSHNPQHKPVLLLALDEALPGNRFCGVSVFSNSFGQPTEYLYAGQQFTGLLGSPKVFLKVTAGILYGYVAPYQDKVPLSHNGFSPALIPSLGYKINTRDSVQMKILGSAGLIFS